MNIKERRKEYRDFPSNCNFGSKNKRAKDGWYKSVDEINEDFDKCIRSAEHWRQKTIESFEKSQQCQHEYGQPFYYVKSNILEFYYEFGKTCTLCGHTESICPSREYNENNPPEGFENPSKRYWNNNI